MLTLVERERRLRQSAAFFGQVLVDNQQKVRDLMAGIAPEVQALVTESTLASGQLKLIYSQLLALTPPEPPGAA